jgi:hypothetical protein
MENNRKVDMKMSIFLFIIGVLVGAIISTSAFIISVNVLGANKSNNGQSSQMQGGGTPQKCQVAEIARMVNRQLCQAKAAAKTATNPRGLDER